MKKTLENKARFIAQYWGQSVFRNINYDDIQKVGHSMMIYVTEEDYLELTPISKITDEDAINIAKIMGIKEDLLFIGKILCTSFFDNSDSMGETSLYNMHSQAVDYIRSKGYAIDYNGISVEEQIKEGWVKLKKIKS